MYKIKAPTNSELDLYYKKYAPVVLDRINDYLFHNKTITINLGRTNIIQCKIGIMEESSSFVARFLKAISSESGLRRLLCGDFDTLFKIVHLIKSNSQTNFESITKKRILHIKYVEGNILEDFHAILKDIFVDGIYNTDTFDKTEFIEKRGLTICPYCGMSRIKPRRKDDNSIVKPHIDHFLPKSIYPFFALSFYNLIPACPMCNMKPNKGDQDPLSSDKKVLHLMNPYSFKEDAFLFRYNYNGAGEFDSNNFTVFLDYLKNTHLKHGYTIVTDIERLYSDMTDDLCALWRQMKSLNNSKLSYAKKLLPGATTEDLLNTINVFGYIFDENSSRIYAYYKFNKDLYMEIRKNIDTAM